MAEPVELLVSGLGALATKDQVAAADIGDEAVTSDKIAPEAVTNTALGSAAVTQPKMASNSVGTAEIIDGSVTASKLASTGVTPGSYTNANISVDAQGRLTTASDGEAGQGGGGAVSSVNGQTGAVVLGAADVGAAVDGHLHVPADVTGLESALDGKAAATHTHSLADLSSLDANGGAFTNFRAGQDTIGGAHTFVAADSGREKVFNGASAASWSVPVLPNGTHAAVHNIGTADVTFVPSGVTIRGATALPAGRTGFLSWLPGDVVKIALEGMLADSPVSPHANNQLTTAPQFWVGTQTNYDALTPAAGTIYFVVEP